MTRHRLVADLLFFTGKRGGTETYVRELLPRLAELLPDVELHGITNSRGHDDIAQWFPGALHPMSFDGDNRPVWAAAETFAVDRLAARIGGDLVWCPANFGPKPRRVPTLVTLHDVTSFEHPDPRVSVVTQKVTTWLIRRAAAGATHALTGSEDARQALQRVLGVDPRIVDVVPHGARAPKAGVDVPAELAGLGLKDGRPFVLSTGNRMPHKNFDGLLRAIAQMPPATRPRVVITGSHGDDPLAPLVHELGLSDDVSLLGWVTSEQLEALFRGAAVYACPSLAEGFGLPVVDAMLRGCPVIATDIGVLREVGGDAAWYTDTTDPAVFAGDLARLLDDPAERARLGAIGAERSGLFTWDRSARQTAATIRRTLDQVTARP